MRKQTALSVLVSIVAGLGCARRGATAEQTQRTEPLALAIAFSAHELWIGNDEVETDPYSKFDGALNELKAAVDQLGLEHRRTGDLGLVVSYGTIAKLALAPGPLSRVTGAVFGTQQDYYREIASNLSSGVDLALFELEKAAPARKVLIVLGDGNDINNDAAAPVLARYKQRAAEAGIAVYAIIYKSPVSRPTSVIDQLTSNVITLSAPEDLGTRLASLFHQCCR